MKKITFTLCLICTCILSWAQETETQNQDFFYKNEIGLDLGLFLTGGGIEEIIFIDPTSGVPHPLWAKTYSPNYLFNYKALGRSVNTRMAIGGDWTTKSRGEDKLGSISSLFLKLGLEGFQSLSSKWEAYGGADINAEFYTLSAPLNEASTSKRKSKANVIGWGPVLGLRFKVDQRVNLLFETALRVNHAWEFTQNINSNYPTNPNNNLGEDRDKTTFLSMPLKLLLNYRF